MRGSIKELFEELREKKEKLEEHSQSLEQKVEVRTQEPARSVEELEELEALGEVSQVVSSTLDLQTVLTSIVRHAVQLSKTDAGTIYEFGEARRGIPAANKLWHTCRVYRGVTRVENTVGGPIGYRPGRYQAGSGSNS
mgnify:CR=1 FL=1